MTYVLAECGISFSKYFSMLNANLASVCRYQIIFNRHLQLKFTIKNSLTIFLTGEKYFAALTAGHVDVFFNASFEFRLTLTISITSSEILSNIKKQKKMRQICSNYNSL